MLYKYMFFFNLSFFSPELRSINEEKSSNAFGWTATGSGPGSLPSHQVILTVCCLIYNFEVRCCAQLKIQSILNYA